MSRRRESIEATRERIVAAAFSLHATIGPSRTSIAAIAERAGVQRHTVYHHFPHIDALYEACTTHGMEATGMPSAAGWSEIVDDEVRYESGLGALVAWYRANASMLAAILGAPEEGAAAAMEPDPFTRRMLEIRAALIGERVVPAERRPLFEAAVDHSLAFWTWRTLADGGLDDDSIVALLGSIVSAVVDGSLPRAPSDDRGS